MGFIYIIKNTVNEKVYIGLTTDTLDRRMIKHRSEARINLRDKVPEKTRACRGKSKLYLAMCKHGIDNFYIEMLEEMPDENLDDAEIRYIQQYDAVKNGYNSLSGGSRGKHSDETKFIISERTREGVLRNLDNHRKHEEVRGLPPRIVYVVIKGSEAVAINRHPKCKWKSFTARRYGNFENAKSACVEYYNNL